MFDFAIGSDHGGFSLKKKIIEKLKKKYSVSDFGVHSTESVDYPDIGTKVAHSISTGKSKRGILVCGTGIGMSIVANKFPNVRATLCHNEFTACMSREHNDSNILILGERVIDANLAETILNIWIETPFAGGRHQKRLDKIIKIEKKYMKT